MDFEVRNIEDKPHIGFYKNKNGGTDLYDRKDFKFINAKIDDDARAIMFEYVTDGNIKYIEISFLVLQNLIQGKLN